MIFTQTPQQFAPIGEQLLYRLSHPITTNIDVRIIDANGGNVLSTKRIAKVTEAEFDIAPMLRQRVAFAPEAGATGFRSAQERSMAIIVEASIDRNVWFSSPTRTFLAASRVVQPPAIFSSLPAVRIIAPHECDEIALFTSASCRVTVTAQCGETTIAQSYSEQGAGVHLFCLNMVDFAGAETLTVDAGVCGVVEYTVDSTPHRGQRLCWRTTKGSIEHYTFPFEREQTIEVAKSRAYGADGYVTSQIQTEMRTILRSAFELRDVVESLVEILASPQVWRVDGQSYTSIDVVSSKARIHSHDAVGFVEVEYRPTIRAAEIWS